jgi:FdhD protein
VINEYTTRQWKPGESFLTRDRLVEEEPLTISLNGKTISITMRTPGHDRELGTGFLITEGIIRRHSDIQCWEHDRNRIEFALSPEVIVDLEGLPRYFRRLQVVACADEHQ